MKRGGIANESISVALLRLAATGALLIPAACKPPTDARWPADPAAARRGLAVIERVQCGACHVIDGVDWPRGRSGPSLSAYGDRGPIAGALPQRPGTLAEFIRNAPAVKPGSPMPEMPITAGEARDVATYLYEARP